MQMVDNNRRKVIALEDINEAREYEEYSKDVVSRTKSSTVKRNSELTAELQKRLKIANRKISSLKSEKKKDARHIIEDETLDRRDDLSLVYSDKHYKFWLKYFSKKENARFLRHMKNGEKYRSTVYKILESHGLPHDLFFVGLIESGFNTHIRSKASAVGPWQFIKGTATRYGMRVDSSADERRNIHKSTQAAAGYFKDLYNIFGSWELALCAYNAGEYRIINAIRRGNTRDYRELVRKKLIPKETIFYIPKVAAAREIFKNKRKYNFPKYLPSDKTYLHASEKRVKTSFSMNALASKLGMKRSDLKRLNPDFKRNWVRAGRRGVDVVIPNSFIPKFKKLKLAYNGPKRINKVSQKRRRKYVSRSISSIYKVKKGDNLYQISRKFGVSLKSLKKNNKLKRSKIFVGQKIKIPGNSKSSITKYKVKRGDNLTVLAKRFNTSINRIVRLNGLKRKVLYKGETIRIPQES
jgi:membrane-bound lytic murein transglycosylase D